MRHPTREFPYVLAALAALPPDVRSRLTDPDLLAERLTGWYATPPRHYHTLAHVEAMLGEWRALRDAGVPGASALPAEWAAAVLFHDAVYVAGRPDNEARSAALAERHAAQHFPGLRVPTVTRLIALTALHGATLPPDLAPAERLFLDTDMAILGAPPEQYRRYAAGVRAEFVPAVGSLPYRFGRAKFLRALLASERIFLSDHYHERRDARARANLREELESVKLW